MSGAASSTLLCRNEQRLRLILQADYDFYTWVKFDLNLICGSWRITTLIDIESTFSHVIYLKATDIFSPVVEQ